MIVPVEFRAQSATGCSVKRYKRVHRQSQSDGGSSVTEELRRPFNESEIRPKWNSRLSTMIVAERRIVAAAVSYGCAR